MGSIAAKAYASEYDPGKFIYVGVDVHKDSHTAVITNCFSQKIQELKISNLKKDFKELVTLVRKISLTEGKEVIFGLEDSYGYGLRLAGYLVQERYPVKIVAPVLVDRLRKNETHPEKNDSLDALGVAKVLIQRTDTLPSYSISRTDEISKDIKALVVDRDFLIKEQTRIKNQLHRFLHKAYNSEYRGRFRDPFSLKALKYWHKYPIPRNADDAVSSSLVLKSQIKRKVKRLLDIRDELKEIQNELAVLLAQTGQKLETMNGAGIVLASSVIAEVRNISRFKSPQALAKYAGLAPKERSTGKTFRHIKTKTGNRKLNMAIHRIALSQISRSGNDSARKYFEKKTLEGKTKNQALCCLKRRLVDIIFMMLKHKEPYRYIAKEI